MKKVNPETGEQGVYSRSSFKVPETATAKDIEGLMKSIGMGFVEGLKEVAKYRKDNPKKNSEVKTTNIADALASMSEEEKAHLLALLGGTPKAETPKKKAPAKKADDDLDLDFTSTKSKKIKF
jgi:3-keto-L-gulonate-6-phosphate decarboxylase